MKPRKKINGVVSVRCNVCNEWAPYRNGQAHLCAKHWAEYRREYRKKNPPKIKYIKKTDKATSIQNLYQNCTPEQRRCLETGDVEGLRKLEVKR